MTPPPETNEFEVATLHPGVTRDKVRESTGWPIRFKAVVDETPAPSGGELSALRDLMERTAVAHGVKS